MNWVGSSSFPCSPCQEGWGWCLLSQPRGRLLTSDNQSLHASHCFSFSIKSKYSFFAKMGWIIYAVLPKWTPPHLLESWLHSISLVLVVYNTGKIHSHTWFLIMLWINRFRSSGGICSLNITTNQLKLSKIRLHKYEDSKPSPFHIL